MICVVREHHPLALLVGVGLLRGAADEHFAVEYARRAVVDDALVQLVGVAAGLGVVHERVVVHVLVAACDVEAVEA